MKRIEVYKYVNGTSDEEAALIIENKVVLRGDYYHDKIDETILGFIEGLKYCGYNVGIYTKIIDPNNTLFDTIGFYNAREDDTDEIECINDDEYTEETEYIGEDDTLIESEINEKDEILTDYHFRALHYDTGYRQIDTQDIIEAINYAYNYDADLYDGDSLIFSPLGFDFDYNNELLKNYGVEFTNEDDGYSSINRFR